MSGAIQALSRRHPPLSITPGAGQDCGPGRAACYSGGATAAAAAAAADAAFRPAAGMAAGGGPHYWYRSRLESGPLGYIYMCIYMHMRPLLGASRLGRAASYPPWTDPLRGTGALRPARRAPGCSEG